MNKSGTFTISLDFELYWGVRDKRSIDDYRHNLEGVRKAVPAILESFSRHAVHATWATVGFLFFSDRTQLLSFLPELQPTYADPALSPYPYIQRASTLDARYHFAPDLIEMISACKGQEIGTHTFSHYYCLESGQTNAQFAADMEAALAAMRRHGVDAKSMVFPRNQWNQSYLQTLREHGIQCFRGNETNWMYAATDGRNNPVRRAARLLDAYVNLSGHNTYRWQDCVRAAPFDFPSSRFLRPVSGRLKAIHKLHVRRIKRQMLYAAKNHRIFHVWWHPHNFGTNLPDNIRMLEDILDYYGELHRAYGMKSLNMGELCASSGQR